MGLQISVAEIARQLGGTVEAGPGGSEESLLSGFAALVESGAGDLSFYGNERYLQDLQSTKAGAVLVPMELKGEFPHTCLIRVENPSAAFGALMKEHMPPSRAFEPGVHASAFIGDSVEMDPSLVHIGACATIESGAQIGEGTTIRAGAHVGRDCVVGKDCLIHPNATILDRCLLGNKVTIHSGVVIGGDGFGFELVDGRHQKIEQMGIVQIDDDVEVGACTTIDRARFGKTWIGEGTKIDNHFMVAHNAVVGKHCLLVAHGSIAGSACIGDYVTIAGHSAVSGHVRVCSNVLILGMCGVTKNITKPGAYMGFPASEVSKAKRQMVDVRSLPKIKMRLKELEARLKE